MKRLFTTICLAVLGIATFSSCQKEEQVVINKPATGEAIMRVEADAVPTRTYISEVDATHYNLGWSAGDEIACFEVSMVEVEGVPTATVQGKVTSSPLDAAGASASFEMDFSGNEGSGNFSYIFVYPASKYTKTEKLYRALIEKDQTFSSTSFDKNADLLISRAITGQASRPTTVEAQFERIGATALMNIKAPTTTETIRKITFSTTEGNIQGYYKIYPLDGTHETALYSGGKSIELTPASTTTYTGTIPVWFRLAEITLDDNFTVVVETNKKTYTKVVNLAAAGRSIGFANSGLTKFNVNMTAVEGEDNVSLANGDYYIVAKHSDNYYAMSSTASGSRLSYVKLDDFNPNASCYAGLDEGIVWTVTNGADVITIEHGSGVYLTSGDGVASTGATEKTYTLAPGSASGTLRLNSVQNEGYGLRYNANSKFFAFYNSAVSSTMIGDMYFMPKDPRPRVAAPSNVDADAAGSTITVIWDDAADANIDHYHVTLYLDDVESDSADVSKGDETCEFTGLTDGAYSVSVEAVASDSATHLNSVPVVVGNLIVGSGPLTHKYTFTSKSWAATLGGDAANWVSNNDGSATGDDRGISIQAAASGAGATSPVSYVDVSNVTITLSKSSKGVGKVDVYVGATKVGSQSTFSTSATPYSFDVSDLDGEVSFVVTCTTSTLYVKDVSITAASISAGGSGSGGGDPTEHVALINFGSGSGDTNVNAASVSGKDSENNTWTVTTVGTTSFTGNADYAQIGSSSKPATSITFTTTLGSSASNISLRAKFGGFSGTAGTVALKVGDNSIGSGSLSASSDVTVSSTSTGSGTVLTVTVTNISKGVKAYWIEATYTN